MKLSVFGRVLLALLLIIAIVFSFVLFGMAANLIPEDMVTGFISLFYYAWQNALILAGVGLVLLAISIKLLFAGRGAKAPAQPTTALIRQSEIGGAFITLPAIDSMVQRHCRAQARVRDCYSTVRAAEDGVSIGIRLHVLPDTDAVKLTEELQQSLKTYIESLTGVHVRSTDILVENMNATPAGGVSRVE